MQLDKQTTTDCPKKFPGRKGVGHGVPTATIWFNGPTDESPSLSPTFFKA